MKFRRRISVVVLGVTLLLARRLLPMPMPLMELLCSNTMGKVQMNEMVSACVKRFTRTAEMGSSMLVPVPPIDLGRVRGIGSSYYGY